MIWMVFISLAGALLSGLVLVAGGSGWMGHGVDVVFGLSIATFIGSLVTVIARKAVKMLSESHEGKEDRYGRK